MLFVPAQATESEMGDVDLSGLPEAPVDSEEEEEDEDIERSSEALLGRDLVRECLEKDAVDRTDDDIGKALGCWWKSFCIIRVDIQFTFTNPQIKA